MSEFPNGKAWWQYSDPRAKPTAYVVHCNWVKSNKKGRLYRDNLWALDQHDQRCVPSWDPNAEGCTRFCRPSRYCKAGEVCKKEPCSKLRGREWHPMALREAGCRVPNVTAVSSALYTTVASSPSVY